MEHRGLLAEAVERGVGNGASYVEARFGRTRRETMTMADGAVDGAGTTVDQGLGVRVLIDGAWGFAASSVLDGRAVTEMVERATTIARRAHESLTQPAEMAPHDPVQDEVEMLGAVDPASVPVAERIELMREVHAALAATAGISGTRGHMDIHRDRMELLTSEGTEITQEVGVVGGGYVASAEGNGTTARRSFPHHGGWDYATAGFEWFQEDRFLGSAARIAAEAVTLLQAEACPTVSTTVVLDPAMIGTVLHETVGHATELDRILGDERDNFGGSFVTVERIGSFPYAAPIVSVAADATFPGGAGSYRYDAEGVAAQRVPVIERGVLTDATNSRECAAVLSRRSNGTARASAWNRIPMARMTNVYLEPGNDTLESLIGDVEDGIYIATDAMTDIDDNRELCSFGGEIGWRIRSGRLAEPIKRPYVYTDTHSLLGACDGIGSADERVVTGILGCGKGQPWQFIFTGQGGPPARFRNVSVGPPRG